MSYSGRADFGSNRKMTNGQMKNLVFDLNQMTLNLKKKKVITTLIITERNEKN